MSLPFRAPCPAATVTARGRRSREALIANNPEPEASRLGGLVGYPSGTRDPNGQSLAEPNIVRAVPRIYHREHAGRPRRVVWVLEEIGEPYELTIMSREQGSGEEHRARHPLGRVPVLELDDGYLFESAAICLHLADLHPHAGLIGELGTRARALAYQWSIFAPAELEPPLIEGAMFREADPERSAKARARYLRAANAVAQSLDGSDYLVEGRFGVADVLVSSALSFSKRAQFPEPLPPPLDDYLATLFQRPAYQRALERESAPAASS